MPAPICNLSKVTIWTLLCQFIARHPDLPPEFSLNYIFTAAFLSSISAKSHHKVISRKSVIRPLCITITWTGIFWFRIPCIHVCLYDSWCIEAGPVSGRIETLNSWIFPTKIILDFTGPIIGTSAPMLAYKTVVFGQRHKAMRRFGTGRICQTKSVLLFKFITYNEWQGSIYNIRKSNLLSQLFCFEIVSVPLL